ncbi:MAG TPA: GNAT family N-acetyltransferase [Streptosporangiaceae bacterium]
MADVGVRRARRADTDAVARIQMRAWRANYRQFVPASVLAELTGADAAEVWRQRWAEAVTAPPSPRHLLLVAVAEDAVVGFAACGPADEADHDPETTAELVTLRVDPDHAREGHDSRLLAAVADLLRDEGFTTVITWLFDADEEQRAFFVSAGWAPDGARRTLTFPVPAPNGSAAAPPLTMIRLHTGIGHP